MPEMRIINFAVMRAFLADLLSPVSPDSVHDSLDLRWTAAISALARYVVKLGDSLLVRDYVNLKTCLMQWLPCGSISKHPKTGKISTCSQPRAFHGPVHRCDKTGFCWEGTYETPKWSFDPCEQVLEVRVGL